MEQFHIDVAEKTMLTPLKESEISEETHIAEHPAGILNCCRVTIDMHARNNPMMVCTHCKQIIKCFEDDRAYKNYVRFCLSRHRKIVADVYNGWLIVVFKSYDTYSS
jgi:hypothetical protein